MSDDTTFPTAIIGAWWRDHIGDRNSSHARGLAARLRRAGPIEALSEPSVFKLAQSLGTADPERIFRVVAVLAHLRGNTPRRAAQAFGTGDPSVLSHLRFQRILRSDGEALSTAIIRALPLIDRSCNAGALGADLFFWGDATRTRWIFDYHGAAQPGTSVSEETTQ